MVISAQILPSTCNPHVVTANTSFYPDAMRRWVLTTPIAKSFLHPSKSEEQHENSQRIVNAAQRGLRSCVRVGPILPRTFKAHVQPSDSNRTASTAEVVPGRCRFDSLKRQHTDYCILLPCCFISCPFRCSAIVGITRSCIRPMSFCCPILGHPASSSAPAFFSPRSSP